MADKPEEKPPEEGADAKAAPAKAKGGGLMATLVSSIVMSVILGGVGFALAYFVLPSRLAQAAAATPAASTTPAAPSPTTPVVDEKKERSPAEVAAQGGKEVTKFSIEEITCNIANTRGNRFVRAGVYFEADPPVLEELEANRARMVDTVGQVLSSKTIDDLTAPTVRGTLREELLGIINPTLKSGRVDNIYFTDLLIQ